MAESVVKMAEDAMKKAQRVLEDQNLQEVKEDKNQCAPYDLEDVLKDQGFYETEVSLRGCRRLRRVFSDCTKNPGHTNFIPIKDFNIEHLPEVYRDMDVVNWIRAKADLTVRVEVKAVSERRPQFFPKRSPFFPKRPQFFPNTDKPFPFYNYRGMRSGFSRTGTGYVGGVYRYAEKDAKTCQCEQCGKTDVASRQKVWGEVLILTAAHVVYDQTESRETNCAFFYDDKQADLQKCLTLSGLAVLECYMEQDKCLMTFATHNMELVDMMDKMVGRCKQVGRKVFYKFRDVSNDHEKDENGHQNSAGQSGDADPEKNICICVSHPHGFEKHISIGSWTKREVDITENFQYRDGREFYGECTQYTYTTPTCRGSSGAIVFSPVRRLVSGGPEWAGLHHPHCEGQTGNVNSSGFAWEALKEYQFSSPPPPSLQKLVNLINKI